MLRRLAAAVLGLSLLLFAGSAVAPRPAAAGYPPTPTSTYRQAVLADAPAGYWRLGDAQGSTTAADASGHGLTGTYRDGAAPGADGALWSDGDTAATLPATSSTSDVYVAPNPLLNFGSGDFTVEAWVNTTVNEERTIVSKYDGASPDWRVTVTDDTGYAGRIHLTLEDPNRSDFYGPSVRVDDGRWHHVIVVVDRAESVQIFVDGVSKETAYTTVGSVSNTAPLRIGGSASDPPLNGSVDEVAVYPTALARGRIREHYSLGFTAFDGRIPYPAAVKDHQPSAYWRLNDPSNSTTAADSSGNGLTGTWRYGAYPGAAGALRSEYKGTGGFFSADSKGPSDIYVPDNPKLNFGAGDFTVEAWVCTGYNQERTIVAKYDGTAPNWRITVTDDGGYVGRVRATIEDPNRSDFYGPDIRVDDNTFHHVVVVFKRGQYVRIYVDGVASETPSPTTGTLSNTAPLRIGATANYPPMYGSMDEVAVYPTALTPDQVLLDYKAGTADPPSPYGNAVLGDQPVAFWRLDEAAGATTAQDASGNNLAGSYRSGVSSAAAGALQAEPDTGAYFPATYSTSDIYVADNPALDFGTGPFAVEAWIRTSYNGERTIISKYDGTSPNWRLSVTDDTGYVGRVRAVVEAPGRQDFYGPNIRVDDGAWHHVAAVFDPTFGVTIYVDGVAKMTPGPWTGSVSNTAPVRIGAAPNYPNFLGWIDEVSIFGSAVDASDIRDHLNADRVPPAFPDAVKNAYPRGYWRLGEGADAPTAFDSSGYGYSGTYQTLQSIRTGIPGAIDGNTALRDFVDTGAYDGVSFGDNNAFDFGGASFTVSAFVRTKTAQDDVIISKGDYSNPKWFLAVTNAAGHVGQVRALISDGVSTLNAYGPPIRVDDNHWHQVVAVFTRGVGTYVYVDGVEAFTSGSVTGSVSNSVPLVIGDIGDLPAFHGDIDEVTIFPRALSPAEVGTQFRAASDGGPLDGVPDDVGQSTPGVVRMGTSGSYSWNLATTFGGSPFHVFDYQASGTPVVGDWDGDGVATPGVVVNGNHWILSDGYGGDVDRDFIYGNPGDTPVVGDWNGDGIDTPGVRRGHTWYLSDTFDGTVDHVVGYGNDTGDDPVAGDWNGDGVDTIGVRRGNNWYLSDTFSGTVDHSVTFGNATGDVPVVGDWNGDGKTSVGVRRGSEWLLTNDDSGAVVYDFTYGNATGDMPVTGDWSGTATETGWDESAAATAAATTTAMKGFVKSSSALDATTAASTPALVTQLAPLAKFAGGCAIYPSGLRDCSGSPEPAWPARVQRFFLKHARLRFKISRHWWVDRHVTVAGYGMPARTPGRLGQESRDGTPRPWSYRWNGRNWYTWQFTRPGECCHSGGLPTDNGFYLDIPSKYHVGNPNLSDDALYYEYYPYDYVGYWFFYAYDNGAGPQNHEGDWEGITIKLNSSNQPVTLYTQAHGCGWKAHNWSTAQKDNGHPIVYIASGTHGTYAVPNASYLGGVHNCHSSLLPNDWIDNSGPSWATWNSSLYDVFGQPWYGFGGAWGDIGDSNVGNFIGGTTGPRGPRSILPKVKNLAPPSG